jgi:hypothetical protein
LVTVPAARRRLRPARVGSCAVLRHLRRESIAQQSLPL